MNVVLALAGDTMLGRGVAAGLGATRRRTLFSAELEATVSVAYLFVLNLECCISRRGTRWPAPGKQFFFRAPPEAAETLARLGVDCVTLVNNHALDFGREALLDTIMHLAEAGIRSVGVGLDVSTARAGGARSTRLTSCCRCHYRLSTRLCSHSRRRGCSLCGFSRAACPIG